MPTRRLPARPNLAHLKHQAADLLDGLHSQDVQVLQRLREFHPRLQGLTDAQIAGTDLKVADAQLAIAREYGFPSWPKLKTFVEAGNGAVLELPAHERVDDARFRHAVDLADCGNVPALGEYLAQHPDLVRMHVTLYGGNYFRNPTLLEFIAENPSRHGTVPQNVVDVARVILDAGARENRAALDSTLGLVASSRVAKNSGVQQTLLDVLGEYGANANSALLPALFHGEFDAAEALLQHGAALSLPAASALGRTAEVRRLVKNATSDERRIALALASEHGRTDAVRELLAAGTDARGYTPPPGHSHATPLHQAAVAGHQEIVELLLHAGASTALRDTIYNGTPADWAEYGGFPQLALRLRA